MLEIVDNLRRNSAFARRMGNPAAAELTARAASVIENQETELQQLRSQLDGWRQFMRLRREVDEIRSLLSDSVEGVPTAAKKIREIFEQIQEREI